MLPHGQLNDSDLFSILGVFEVEADESVVVGDQKPLVEHVEVGPHDGCVVRLHDIDLGRAVRSEAEPLREAPAGVHGGHQAGPRVRRNARERR